MQTTTYTGPAFHLINAMDERNWEVKDNSGNRIGVYWNADMAKRVAADCDKSALKAYLKAQKKAQRAAR